MAPRILFEDLQNFSPSIVRLDIRPSEEFSLRSTSGSVHLNLKETTFRDLEPHKGKHIAVIGDRGDNAPKVGCVFQFARLTQVFFRWPTPSFEQASALCPSFMEALKPFLLSTSKLRKSLTCFQDSRARHQQNPIPSQESR